MELELWLLLPFLLWKRLWPLPPLPEPLGAWSRPMVLSYLDTKIVYLFIIVEPIATTIYWVGLGASEGLGIRVIMSPLLDIT